MTYDEAVRIIKGEQDVNGVNSIKSLEDELASKQAQVEAIETEIADKETKIASGGLKKRRNQLLHK